MTSQLSLESFDSKKHMMLVYDDVDIGRKIEFDFIKMGLEKNEISIYVTHGQVNPVEKDMASFGINVNDFKKKGILHVVDLGNPAEETLGFIDYMQLYMQKILPNPEIPFRIVGRAIPDVGMDVAMSIQAKWEKILHNGIFNKLNGSILCTYDLSQIKANNQWMEWLKELRDNHHVYIVYENGKTEFTVNPN